MRNSTGNVESSADLFGVDAFLSSQLRRPRRGLIITGAGIANESPA